MSYYKLCPECGAALDPGEVCDCRTSKAEQFGSKKAVVNAANTDNGKAGYGMLSQIPASHDNRD